MGDTITWNVNGGFGGVDILKKDVVLGENATLEIELEYLSLKLKIVAVANDTV